MAVSFRNEIKPEKCKSPRSADTDWLTKRGIISIARALDGRGKITSPSEKANGPRLTIIKVVKRLRNPRSAAL